MSNDGYVKSPKSWSALKMTAGFLGMTMCEYSQTVWTCLLSSLPEASRILTDFYFIGKMDYEPNIDAALYFCNAIFPHIRKVEPRAHVYIVACEPSEEPQALHTGIDVFVTGAVPDATPYLDAAGIVIVPIRFGRGTRIKILDAFAHRKAVVSTTIGSEGLAVEQGVHLYLADTPRDFAGKCLALMTDASMRKGLGMAGRELLESRYSRDVFHRSVSRCVSEVVISL